MTKRIIGLVLALCLIVGLLPMIALADEPHTHTPAVVRQSFYRVDVHNNSVAPVDKLFVNTGSALEYGGYGQRAGYIPASNKTPKIHLNGRFKEATATV